MSISGQKFSQSYSHQIAKRMRQLADEHGGEPRDYREQAERQLAEEDEAREHSRMANGEDKPEADYNAAEKEFASMCAQHQGGEWQDWLQYARRTLAPDGEKWNDERLTKIGYRLVATYNYTAPNGMILYQVLRYHHDGVPGEKTFQLRRPGRWFDSNKDPALVKSWVFGQGQIKVPYRWPELIARADDNIYLCEGEKDADLLAGMGLLATTLAGQKLEPSRRRGLQGSQHLRARGQR
jgi:hypothetical protein